MIEETNEEFREEYRAMNRRKVLFILAFILPDIHIFPLFTEILRFMIVLYYECPVFCKLSAI